MVARMTDANKDSQRTTAGLRADLEAAANPDIRDNDRTLAAMARLLRAVPALLHVVEEVADKEYAGGGTWDSWCVFCGGDKKTPHADDCAFLIARKLTGGAP
jgi:hypothetical protein